MASFYIFSEIWPITKETNRFVQSFSENQEVVYENNLEEKDKGRKIISWGCLQNGMQPLQL